ncbi:MAG: hypothetical protein RL264_449 [Bacteroidota bacterium]|jgi:dTDP-glucose pyrophosphorylase
MTNKHIIKGDHIIREAIQRFDELSNDAVLFIVDDENRLLGSLTDGDVRRGLMHDKNVTDRVQEIMNIEPHKIVDGKINVEEIKSFRENNYKIVPIVDEENKVLSFLNFRLQRSILPVDVVIMAGGKGQRLLPLTENTPKPLLKIGEKPVIEYNIDRLIHFGVKNIYISVNYLGHQIEEYFGDGSSKGINIRYIHENEPLGTIGAITNVAAFDNDYLMVLNSDLLTNIDFEDFFIDFMAKKADLSVVGIPYQVNIPFGVLEMSQEEVVSFKEKPTYTYYSNGGIYLFQRTYHERIPKETFYNAPDLIDDLIASNKKVISYPMLGYWLDIGSHSDYSKAKEDIKKLSL